VISRDQGKINFECDSCDETLETETEDFREAMAEFRAQRWQAQRIGNEWVHSCHKARCQSA